MKLAKSWLARSTSDEAISAENKDCFAALVITLTLHLNFIPLWKKVKVRGLVVSLFSSLPPPVPVRHIRLVVRMASRDDLST